VQALLPQVRCPTLVLHSRNDVRVPVAEGVLIASGIPGAQFVPLDSGNHLLLGDEPGWQQWVEAVRAFLPQAAHATDPAFAALTERQRELLELLAQGRDNAQIAASMSLSEKTVRNQISALYAKLEVDTRAQAIVRARDSGFGRLPR
jgi:DNA-binding CsgD family transcriptional regulator